MKKRFLSCLMALTLMGGTCFMTSCKNSIEYDADNFLPNGTAENPWQIVKEPISINIFVPVSNINPEYDTLAMFKTIERLTNIDITFTEANVSAYENLRNMAWSDEKTRPDLFLFNNSVQEQVMYSKMKVIVPFNDPSFVTMTGVEAGNIIDNYMPNYKQLLDNNFGVEKGVGQKEATNAKEIATLDDGYMYSTLTVNTVPRDLTYKMYINQSWIDNYNTYYAETGSELPNSDEIKTYEQLVDVLRAFKNYDVDRDGNNNNEIPVSSVGLKFLRNFVLQTCGYVSDGYEINVLGDITAEESEFVYVPSTEQYREYLRKMKQLYAEKLLDNCFSSTDSSLVEKGSRLGMFQSAAPYLVVGKAHEKEYEVLSPLTSNYYSGTPIHLGFGSFMPIGAVIPTSTPYVREIARLLDLMYSDVGCQLIAYGEENVHWTWDDEEHTSWTFNVPDGWYESGKTQEDYRATLTPNVGTANALYWNYDFVGKMNDETIRTLNKMSETYTPYLKTPIPQEVKMTFDEYNTIAIYESTLNNFVTSAERYFIIGTEKNYDVESDTDWGKYLETLKGYRSEEMLNIYNSALTRYKEANKK